MTDQATIEAVPQLGEAFKGEVIAPGDLRYDDARAGGTGRSTSGRRSSCDP